MHDSVGALLMGQRFISIFFAHQKNNQTGERTQRHPRNIYPNPIEPFICPLLSLSLYFTLFPDVLAKNGPLFPGQNQCTQFSGLLSRVLESNKEQVAGMGQNINYLGVHSICKGAATYASSGSTAGPSGAAVNLRVGWTLGHVQDTYIWYEAAGDQYVGRVLCGLPVNLYKFALLGPCFVLNSANDETLALSEQICKCVSSCFLSSLPSNFYSIATHCLACCLYHFDTLVKFFPETHHLHSCYLFKGIFTEISLIVKCGLPWAEDFLDVASTGIPPHVAILAQMQELHDTYGHVSEGLLKKIVDDLDQRQMGGVLSEDRIRELFRNELALVRQEIGGVRMQLQAVASDKERDAAHWWELQNKLYFMAGKFRHVPAGWSFPQGTTAVMWLGWVCPDEAHGVSPLSCFTLMDMNHLT